MAQTKKIKNDSLRTNFIFNIIHQVVVVLSPIILTPKLARVFGAEYLGIRSFTFSIVYYFAIFGVLGLDLYGQRKIALEKDDEDRRSQSFWTIFTVRFILVGLFSIAYVGYFCLFSSTQFEKIVFACWIVYLVREMINPIWFLQGIEKYKILSILNIISQVLYVALSFILIKSKEQLPLYVLIFSGVPFVISLCYFPVVLKYVKYKKPRRVDMVKSIKES